MEKVRNCGYAVYATTARRVGLCLGMLGAVAIASVATQAASVNGTVSWGTSGGDGIPWPYAGDWAYGLNLQQGSDSSIQSNSTYKNNRNSMGVKFWRYHALEMMRESRSGYSGYNRLGWVTNPSTSAYAWDRNKIWSCLDNRPTGATILINIPNWPAYMDDGTGKLKTSMYGSYANFCADLVKAVNKDRAYGIQYFEVLNEKNRTYGSNIAEMATIYKTCYDAMKLVDNTIKVGGPAFENAWDSQVDGFIANAHAKLDFVSHHSYTSGNTADTNQAVWNSARNLGGNNKRIRDVIKKYTTRNILVFHNEFNISYTPPDTKMNNEIGMIYDAIAMKYMNVGGATGTNAWSEADGWYGKLNNDSAWTRRPSSYLFQVFNERMKGNVASASSSDAQKLEVYAVTNGSYRAYALINRSEADQTVQMSFSGIAPSSGTAVNVYKVQGTTITSSATNYGTITGSTGYALPRNSVIVFTLSASTVTTANLMSNPGFEAEQFDSQTPSGWTEWSSKAGVGSGYTQNNSTNGGTGGSYHLAHYNSVPYNIYTSQLKTGLVNGLYTARAWARKSGSHTCRLTVKNYGSSERVANVPASSTYQLIEIKDINVTNGQCVIGLWSDTTVGGAWAVFDDVEFIKQ